MYHLKSSNIYTVWKSVLHMGNAVCLWFFNHDEFVRSNANPEDIKSSLAWKGTGIAKAGSRTNGSPRTVCNSIECGKLRIILCISLSRKLLTYSPYVQHNYIFYHFHLHKTSIYSPVIQLVLQVQLHQCSRILCLTKLE